jgi:hypothetical protein
MVFVLEGGDQGGDGLLGGRADLAQGGAGRTPYHRTHLLASVSRVGTAPRRPRT